MQQNQSNKHQFAYKRQPSSHIYSSTFNPNLPSGHTTTIRQYEGNPYSPATTFYGSGSTAVAEEVSTTPAPATSSGSILSKLNLSSLAKYADIDEMKGLVDRFGGLDGILATVTKVQKVMSTVGQIAPMAKVFTGLLGKRSNSNNEESTSSNNYVAARRKQTVKRSSSVKDKARRVQVNKRAKNSRRSKVYTPSGKQRQ